MSAEPEVRWVPVGEVGEVRMGKQLSPANSREGGTHTPYLRVANVLDGWIDYSDVKSMIFDTLERERYSLAFGDILLNEGQSLELVGRSAIYDGHPGKYCFQNTLIRFRSSSLVVPEYAYAVFKQWLNDGTFASVAKKTTSIAHLGGDRFAKIPFPLVPIARQRHIVEVLGAVAESERTLEQEMEKKQKILDGLLSSVLGASWAVGSPAVGNSHVACGEIIKMAGGAALEKAQRNPNGCYLIMSSGGVAGRGDRNITGGPAIVIGRVGEGAGSVYFTPEPVWVTDNALWVSHVAPGWVAEFLAIYLRWCNLGKLRTQTGQPLITQGVIKGVKIPRLSLGEQREIVQIHHACEEEYSESRRYLSKLQSLRNGIVEDLLNGSARSGRSRVAI
ncbi:restriction endonuclease subunit S [Streptomyces sp. NPDC057433]|uniref:restriction endonuclease subunit S n=1 Tax=Streptomyces sp. NPDC057433 TaxID=3346132 RepID=UPI00368007F1